MNGYPMNQVGNSHSSRNATIEVIGEGTAAAPADRAIVVLGAVTEGADLSSIQAENANIMAEIIGSLLRLGIPRDKLQTQEYRVDTNV